LRSAKPSTLKLSPAGWQADAMTLASRLGVPWPIVQAPMAGVQGSALAIAVCKAGGLGSLPAAMLGLDALAAEVRAIQAGTWAPFNVNFFCHQVPRPDPERERAWRDRLAPYYREFGLDPAAIPDGPGRSPFTHETVDAIAPLRPPVVSFHFGLPAADLLARVKAWGALVLSSATTVDEALWLGAHGVDVVIAQGVEAGGHRGMFLTDDLTTQTGTMALVPPIAARVRVPVLAAGGIADARGVRAALALGASGVQVGSAFLRCPEATTSAVHRAALAGDGARHTAITNLFTGRPARGVVNRFIRECGPMGEGVPAFPLATSAVLPLRAEAERRGLDEFSPMWAGQAAAGCQASPAAEVFEALCRGLSTVA
jgi:nitronate monooxygenase